MRFCRTKASSSSPTSWPTPAASPSYFEWVQDRQGYFWKEAQVNAELEHIMIDCLHRRAPLRRSARVNNRIAAYMLAIDRVASTTRTRGIYA